MTIQQQDLRNPGLWTNWGTFWASLRPVSGREVPHESMTDSEPRYEMRTLFIPGFKPQGMRVLFEGKPYNIVSVLDKDMVHSELITTLTADVNQG